MNNHFLSHPDKLRYSWKQLRAGLTRHLSDIEHMAMVIDWWKSAPYGKPYLDYLDPQKWPSPWLLLEHGIYDQSSVSLGIYYTMLMADDQRWNSDRLRLCMLRNTQLCHENLTCIVDAKFLLGFEFGRITELQSVSDTTILHSYNYDVDRRCVMEIKMTDFEPQ